MRQNVREDYLQYSLRDQRPRGGRPCVGGGRRTKGLPRRATGKAGRAVFAVFRVSPGYRGRIAGSILGEPARGTDAQAGRWAGVGHRHRPARSSAANAAAGGLGRTNQTKARRRSRLHANNERSALTPSPSPATGEGNRRPEPAISALVTYRWDAKQPVLRKFVEITNKSDRELNRLLNVRLGTYRTDAKTHRATEQGFPAYLNGEFFLSLAHPAGWATAKDGPLSLRQYPGIKVAPGKSFECMEAVYGVAKPGEARKAFVAHLRSRMRRVVRGHDKPYRHLRAVRRQSRPAAISTKPKNTSC